MTAPMNRMGFIGGSDAARIVRGDWLSLYEEKVGIRQPENLDDVFRVQLGKWTEPFHRSWLVDKLLMQISESTHPHENPDAPFMRGQIDGWWHEHDTFIELKHTNERASVRSMSESYLPQIAHYCLCTQRDHGYLSFIAGNNDPVICKVEPGRRYFEELEAMERSFWWHVTEQVAPLPPDTAVIEEAAKHIKVDGLRFVDMTGNNQWADLARTILETKDAAELHDKSRTAIKELVEKDVAEAAGHGLAIKRDKRGALRFTFSEAA